MAKIILVQVNRAHGKIRANHGHVGLAYLAACALEKGHETAVCDAMYEGLNNVEVLERIKAFKPDVVGFTAKTPDIKEVEQLAGAIKEFDSATTIIIGGAHLCGLGERVLRECEHLDLGVYGEGEITLVELLECLEGGGQPMGEIDGLFFRENNSIIKTNTREMIKDLDTLPIPAWQLLRRGSDMPLFTSRGCPFACIFCQRVMTNRVRMMSTARILELMESAIKNFNTTFFQIADETFGLNKRMTHELLDEMMARGISKKVKWIANSQVRIADLELYKKMRAAGCIGLGFGMESGNQEILDFVRKGFTLEQAEQAIAWTKEAKLESHVFFILGHPHETKKTIRDTINFACKLKPTDVAFGLMIPYPGTGVYELARRGEGGYVSCSEDWGKYTKYSEGVLELEHVTGSQLSRLQKQAYLEFLLRNFRFKAIHSKIRDYLIGT